MGKELDPVRHFCRACNGRLHVFLDLGNQPPSNALLRRPDDRENFYPLQAAVCEDCFLMQVNYDVSPLELFGDYVYFSSGSKEWLDHTRRYCEQMVAHCGINTESQIIEIGSNDGHLLGHFKAKGVERVLGVDPSYSVAQVAIAKGIDTMVAHFGTPALAGVPLADLVICNNVMAHVPNLNDFISALSRILKPRGTLTIEFPHVVNLLNFTQFDTIYHEHYSYLSLKALEPALGRYGLFVYDVEFLPTHGGSLRVFVQKNPGGGDRPDVRAARHMERYLGDMTTYRDFANRAAKIRQDFSAFLLTHTVYGYGAAAKGNTFLNYCGVSRRIPCVGDVTPAKQGKYLPGSHIPVCDDAALLAQKPPYVLILPWNWRNEIVARLGPELRKGGGHFVVAIPELEVWKA